MRQSFVRFALLGSMLVVGCAKPTTTTETTGTGNSAGSGTGNSTGSGTGNSTGTGTGNSTGSGGSSTGSGGSSATGGSTGTACTPNPAQLVNASAWNCDASDPIAIQGAIYGYTDGSSCASPQPANICSTGSCCISGTTVVDATSAKWGCGIGMELNDAGGTTPVKGVYAGTAKCFNITLTGSSGGNEVRIGFSQSANSTTAVAPYVPIAAFANGWSGQVCFTDANCPSWATTAQCSKAAGAAGTPYDMQIQVSAGATAAAVGTYNVCVSSIVPVSSTGGGGMTNSCSSTSGTGTISDQYGTGVVTCNSKEYIVQNNAWGSTAGQTITYGSGPKFKVTVQKGTGASNNPAGFPSVFTGANANHNTGSTSMLPRAVSSIPKGSVMTSWTWADNGATGSYNAAYDVWFSTSSAGEPAASSPSGGFLMVWYHMPTSNQPIGSMVASATIGGKGWNVWYGTNSGNGKPCVTYAAQQSISSLTYSLGDFIQDAVGRGYVQSTWYLTNVFAGFEIWNGGTGLEVTDFSVTVP